MRTSWTVVIVALLTAAPLFAQQTAGESSNSDQETRGYLTAVGGLTIFSNFTNFSTAGNQGTPDIGANGGIRIAPHLMVFGDGGWIRNLQREIQPVLVTTTTALFTNHKYIVTGTGSVPVWYGMGGLRIAGPKLGQFTPYVLGGAGIAHLMPKPHFTYTSGTLPGVTTPAAGADVTASLVSAGDFKAPVSSSELMLSVGGGLQLAMGQRGVADAGYRYSRIAADTALNSGTVTTNTLSIGLGVRF